MPDTKIKGTFLGGYSKRSVDTHLKELEHENQKRMDALRSELADLKAQYDQIEKELSKYRDNERYVSRAIIFAENFAREMEMKARKEFDGQVQKRREYLSSWRDSVEAQRNRLAEAENKINEITSAYVKELSDIRNGMSFDIDQELPPVDDAATVRMPQRPSATNDILASQQALGEDMGDKPAQESPPAVNIDAGFGIRTQPDSPVAMEADIQPEGSNAPPINDREELARICKELGLMEDDA